MSAVVSILLVLIASTPVTVRQRDVNAAETYLAHIVRYHSGDHSRVIRELAKWNPDDLKLALRGLPAVLFNGLEQEKFSTGTVIATAMLVHVDIAKHADGPGDIDHHLSIGERLSDLLPLDAAGEAFKARWHLMAGTLMFSLSRLADAQRQFETARRLAPQEPEILLALGSVYEVEGSMRPGHNATSERLKEASKLYRSVLAVAPDLSEARLRLARTQLLLGDMDAAAAAIAPIDRRTIDPHLRYLTLLLGGSVDEAAGRLEQAVAGYRQARALCNGCHSATLALSHALLRIGNRGTAHELVDDLVNDTTWPPRADPWWVYQQGQWYVADAMLEQLRRQVPK